LNKQLKSLFRVKNIFDSEHGFLGNWVGKLECQSFPLGLVASVVHWPAVVSLPPQNRKEFM